nr:MAG TPA: baseplate wedge protein [Caudoviricetes sp.]
MALKIFENKGEVGAIPINGENLNYNFNEIVNMIFPVGYILIRDDSEDYSNYLGFTWQRVFAGKTLVGFDSSDTDFDTIGKIGGEKTHKLTIDEMPSHSHNAYLSGGNIPSRSGVLKYETNNAQLFGGSLEARGGSQPHNNLQPYYVIAYWKRIA